MSKATSAKAPLFVRFLNPVAQRVLRVGPLMGPNALLTVRGRKSGVPRTTPVALVDIGGRRWVVGTFGEVNWVRNLRAAGEATVTVGRKAQEVRAREFVLVAVRPTATFDLFQWYAAGIVSLAIGIVLHEGGHLVMGLATGEPVRKIRIGSGPTLFGFHVRGLIVQVCLNPIGGGAVYFSSYDAVPGGAHLASLAAGPGMNLLAVVYGLGLFHAGLAWLGPFVAANVLLLVSTAVPSTANAGGRGQASDGMQIPNPLLKPALPKTQFRGPGMAPGARPGPVPAAATPPITGQASV